MSAVEAVRELIPEPARDIRLNLQTVLAPGTLSAAQRWGVAIACAVAARNTTLRDAVITDAQTEVDPSVIDDAFAAAALMAMNNVFYRFRHVIGKESYTQMPARLRMQRIARPLGSKVDFELFCLAVSAINGCEACVRSHEAAVLEGGLTEQHVLDAVRIAATVQAAAVSLEIPALVPELV
jgi:alkyl hydroperoxide reductase subunit D